MQPTAIEVLTGRIAWGKKLLVAIGQEIRCRRMLNLSQVRKLLALGDRDLAEQVRSKWGTVRDQRSPERERVIRHMRTLLRTNHGDAAAGEKVFKRLWPNATRFTARGSKSGRS